MDFGSSRVRNGSYHKSLNSYPEHNDTETPASHNNSNGRLGVNSKMDPLQSERDGVLIFLEIFACRALEWLWGWSRMWLGSGVEHGQRESKSGAICEMSAAAVASV